MSDRTDGDGRDLLRAWGTVIRRYRKWKLLSRRDLASRAGISSVYLGEIERGQKDASTHSLYLIADGLDVPMAELYLRVAATLGSSPERDDSGQSALPLATESGGEYLESVPLSKEETAFELYTAARVLRSDQQVALLLLALSLVPPS